MHRFYLFWGSSLPMALSERSHKSPGMLRYTGASLGISSTSMDTGRPMARASSAARMICGAEPQTRKACHHGFFLISSTVVPVRVSEETTGSTPSKSAAVFSPMAYKTLARLFFSLLLHSIEVTACQVEMRGRKSSKGISSEIGENKGL